MSKIGFIIAKIIKNKSTNNNLIIQATDMLVVKWKYRANSPKNIATKAKI